MSGLFPFTIDGKVGYKDSNDNIVIQPSFDYGEEFHTDEILCFHFAKVGNNGTHGIIDKTGQIIVPVEYDDLELFRCNYFTVKDKGQSGENNIHFLVQKGGKWGLFDTTRQMLSIPCAYDKIIYKTGKVVYLCIGNLWGARSLDFDASSGKKLSVNIEPVFFEIESLDTKQTLFCVLREPLIKKGEKEYTIVNSRGEEIEEMKYSSWDSFDLPSGSFSIPFKYYRRDRILCGSGGKFGFISINAEKGFISVPLKYDVLEERKNEWGTKKDGLFDVCIKRTREYDTALEEWGVIDLEGREIVTVKYASRLPFHFRHTIVKDAQTNRYGLLDNDGRELIPCINEYLKINGSFIQYGYREQHHHYQETNEDDIMWGCFNEKGKSIIPPKYDIIDIKDDYIIAGRNGSPRMSDEYVGVYDLYTKDGGFLLGGIQYVDLEFAPKILRLFVGGHWITETIPTEQYEGISFVSSFDTSDGGWLILDKNLQSIIKTKDNGSFIFQIGTYFDENANNSEDSEAHVLSNYPTEILLKNKPDIIDDFIIIREEASSKVFNYRDGVTTLSLPYISHVLGNLFFAMTPDNHVGLYRYLTDMPLLYGYELFTYPNNGWFFGIKKEGEYYNIDLFHINKNDVLEQFKAATGKTIKEINYRLENSYFNITFDPNETGIKSVAIKDSRSEYQFFDTAFLDLICKSSLNLKPYRTTAASYFSANGIEAKKREERFRNSPF